jgi:hypothetical protein
LLKLGLLLELSLSLLGDLLDVEFMGQLFLVYLGSQDEHGDDDDQSGTEDDQVIGGRANSVVDSELEISPPMDALENVEQKEHTDDLEPVQDVIFINGLIVALVSCEVSTVFH